MADARFNPRRLARPQSLKKPGREALIYDSRTGRFYEKVRAPRRRRHRHRHRRALPPLPSA